MPVTAARQLSESSLSVLWSCHHLNHSDLQLPYYMVLVNLTWSGLWCGLLFTAALLVGLEFYSKPC